jgi:hypothetical protein
VRAGPFKRAYDLKTLQPVTKSIFIKKGRGNQKRLLKTSPCTKRGHYRYNKIRYNIKNGWLTKFRPPKAFASITLTLFLAFA